MRPTTKDLAKAAGVSLATVDRVLNERPGVRKKTVDAVNEAIERIGFVRNQLAANLARQKVYKFVFLLPENGGEFLDEIKTSIDEAGDASEKDGMQISWRAILQEDPHRMADSIGGLIGEGLDGVAIMAPAFPQVRDASSRLAESGVQVVGFVSGQHAEDGFGLVGIDNQAAGATAARLLGRFLGEKTGSVLVIAESMNALDSVDRRLGFDRVMSADFHNLRALPSMETHGQEGRTKTIIENAYRHHKDIVGVYVMASEGRQPLSALIANEHVHNQVISAHERTAFTESALRGQSLDAIIAQSPGHLVRSAVRTLRARCDGTEPVASQERIRIEILLRENLI